MKVSRWAEVCFKDNFLGFASLFDISHLRKGEERRMSYNKGPKGLYKNYWNEEGGLKSKTGIVATVFGLGLGVRVSLT